MVMNIWVKPNGTEIAVNKESEQAAIALGWVPKEAKPEPETRKKRLPRQKD
jgi:hypothetical protein